jgi:hypothetical protein
MRCPVSVCPFCGVVTEVPHENQQVCLDALAAEIARLRSVLEHSEPASVPAPAAANDDDDDPSES